MIQKPGVVVLALLGLACGGESANLAEEPFEWPDHLGPLPPEYVLGVRAPAFELPTLAVTGIGEDSVRLADLRGQVVVMNFWNTGCLPCVAEHGTHNAVAERYDPEGVRYLGINDLDTPETLAAFETRHGPSSYSHLADIGGLVGASYDRTGWPLHVVIDREGKVAWWRQGGPISEETLREVIAAVLDGRRPRSPTGAAHEPG